MLNSLCGIGSATPITIDFGAMFPFTVVPAYATQDSVRGCSLGFAASVIADGRLQRACKAPRQVAYEAATDRIGNV